jgi:hypothetical protein
MIVSDVQQSEDMTRGRADEVWCAEYEQQTMITISHKAMDLTCKREQNKTSKYIQLV